MISSVILTAFRTESYYRYSQFAKIKLKRKGVLSLMESLNGDDDLVKSLGIFTAMTLGCTW